MKLNAEPKDWIMFGCFSVFLLYMCAIGVLNASTLATEGTFYGFLPFEAFTMKYLGATIILFILALVGVFSAVSSYFFDVESGFGFFSKKKDKGYSICAKEKSILFLSYLIFLSHFLFLLMKPLFSQVLRSQNYQ